MEQAGAARRRLAIGAALVLLLAFLIGQGVAQGQRDEGPDPSALWVE